MTRFLDGPAEGQQLMLHRSPLFLRVCIGLGTCDALDMLDDEPADGEALVAYRREGKPTVMFIDYTDKKTRRRQGKVLRAADYRVAADQPHAAVMASAEKWREWCLERRNLELQAGG